MGAKVFFEHAVDKITANHLFYMTPFLSQFRILCAAALALVSIFAGPVQAAYYPSMNHGPERVLAPGVTWRTATHANPAWSIQIIEIDMTEQNIELLPVFRSGGNLQGLPNERPSSMAARVDAIAAINAGYRATDGTNLTNSYTMIDGHFIGGSSINMTPEHNRSALGFSGNHQKIAKRTKLTRTFIPAEPADWEKMTDVIAGRGHFVTSGGILITQDNEGTTTSHHGSRHPRTAIGFSADPYRVWLVTVDGRQTGFSIGMTYKELGKLMADLGVEQTVSLDGGGSTTTWIKGEGVVNSPSDGAERPVISAWAVVPSNTMDNLVEEAAISGNWEVDTSSSELYYLDQFVTNSSAGPASITWTPTLARDGLYKVYAWWTTDSSRVNSAPYEIDHALGSTTVEVDQRFNGGQWNLLETLPFRAGSEGKVTLRNTSPGTISADALRLVRVGDGAAELWRSSNWETLAVNDFGFVGASDFDPLTKNPSSEPAGNSTWQRNFDLATLSSPSIAAPADSNGVVLRTAANNLSPAASQILYQTFGDSATEDTAVEARLLGYLASDNTSGPTTWGGIGIRMSDDFQDGYFVQHRVDHSSSFGSYLNFHRLRGGNTTLLGRYYYRLGTGGITQGTIGDSRVIRSPEVSATNQWVTIRLEAVGDQIALFVDDMELPVTVFSDVDPFANGKAALFHEDPFGNSLTIPANSSGTLFDYFKVDLRTPSEWRPGIEKLDFLDENSVRLLFAVPTNSSFNVEASDDLVNWVTVSGPHLSDANGNLVVEDVDAGNRRFWRLQKTD